MNDPVAIIGAGPVGFATALFLRRRGIASHLYDAATEPTRTSKVLVVNARTLSLLARTGVAEAMIAGGARDPRRPLRRGLAADRRPRHFGRAEPPCDDRADPGT